MKKIIKGMTNVTSKSFESEGKAWTLAPIPKNTGTSAGGLWNKYTDGEKIVLIRKKEVAELNPEYARVLFDEANLNKVTELRGFLGVSRSEFSRRYEIPLRTLEDWESGRRNPPAYVLKLLEEVVKK